MSKKIKNSPKNLPQLQLAKTCSTCKHASFGNADYRMGGKKQGGLCQLISGAPPTTTLSKYAQEQYYFNKSARFCKTPWNSRYFELNPPKEHQKQEMYELDSWWKNNKSKMRLIHRQTVCESWEQGPKTRESFAKRIVMGEETLHLK